MALEIADIHTVTEQYRTDAQESAALSDVYGLLVRERQFRVNDSKNTLNPFAAGILAQNWRNTRVLETDNSGATVYDGAIYSVGWEYTDESKATVFKARDRFGILKEWVVEELLLKSAPGAANRWRTNSANARQFAGSIVIVVDAGTPTLPAVGDIVSFGADIVPRYQVVDVLNPPPSQRIQLDRPLEYDVPANTVLRLMSPVTKSGAAAVRDALLAAGITSLGSSFAALDAVDTAANRLITLFVRRENKVKLIDHLNRVMDMTDLFLTIDSKGVVDVFRGMQYDGGVIFDEITSDDIVLPVELFYDTSRLYYAYDCLFVASGRVQIESGAVSNTLLSAYAARERWQPTQARDESPLSYEYLYANQTSAQFFGNRRITYNAYPRARLRCALKRAKSGAPAKAFDLSLGKQFLLSLDFGAGKKLHREPVRVISYVYDNERQFYSDVVFELTNWLYPALAVP